MASKDPRKGSNSGNTKAGGFSGSAKSPQGAAANAAGAAGTSAVQPRNLNVPSPAEVVGAAVEGLSTVDYQLGHVAGEQLAEVRLNAALAGLKDGAGDSNPWSRITITPADDFLQLSSVETMTQRAIAAGRKAVAEQSGTEALPESKSPTKTTLALKSSGS